MKNGDSSDESSDGTCVSYRIVTLQLYCDVSVYGIYPIEDRMSMCESNDFGSLMNG